MRMGRLWGHALPLCVAGRGHGSRCFLHTLRHGTVMHDASYMHCLQLGGHQRDVLRVLAACRCVHVRLRLCS
jgi:hypothetical protein